MNTVPTEFWFSATLILMAVLIWVIQKYYGSLAETLKELKTNMETLTQLVKLHDLQISNHSSDIKDLKEANKNKRRS